MRPNNETPKMFQSGPTCFSMNAMPTTARPGRIWSDPEWLAIEVLGKTVGMMLAPLILTFCDGVNQNCRNIGL